MTPPPSERDTVRMPIRPRDDAAARETKETEVDPALLVGSRESEPPLPGPVTQRMEMDPELLAGLLPRVDRALRRSIARWFPPASTRDRPRRRPVEVPAIQSSTQRDVPTMRLTGPAQDPAPDEPIVLPVSVWLRPSGLVLLALLAIGAIVGVALVGSR